MFRAQPLRVCLGVCLIVGMAACSGGGLSTTGPAGATLMAITVAPGSTSAPAGTTKAFTATGHFSDGTTKDLTATATWSSSVLSVATISSTGVATAKIKGTTTISAQSGSVFGSAMFTVTDPLLVSIAVSCAAPVVPAGLTDQFTAIGSFTDNSQQSITNSVIWSSSATSIATINSAGLASTIIQGSSTITATSGSISGSTLLTVGAPVLQSLAVTPKAASIASGTTQQFTATGTFSNGSVQDLTTTVTWSSSDITVGTINTLGLAKALKAGMSTIQARLGLVSGSATLNVTNATPVSLLITPPTPSIPVATMQQFTAIGTFTDGTTQDITAAATWSSSATSVAAIASTVTITGLTIEVATALHMGTTTISASFESVSNSTTLTVIKVSPIAIYILPSKPTIPIRVSQQFKAVQVFNDGSVQILRVAKWNSQSKNVAKITPNGGLATAVAVGSTTISATNLAGALTGSTVVTVDDATLTTLCVTPQIPSIPAGKALLFTATGTFSDGGVFDLSGQANWSSSIASVATITNFQPPPGLATGLSSGATTIAASFGSQAASTTLTVTSATVTNILVSPANSSTATGTSLQFGATGFYSDGTVANLKDSAVFSSSDPTIASVTNSGLATGVSAGTAMISATLGSVTGTATLTVTSATLTSIAVTPANPSLPAGVSEQLTATGTFSDGTTQNITGLVHWSAGNSATAIVSNSPSTIGIVTAVGPSVITIPIFASFGSMISSTKLTVTNAMLNSPLCVTTTAPPNCAAAINIHPGESAILAAFGTFSGGSVIELTTQVTWTSSDNLVAVVNGSGLAISAGTAGTTTIKAAFVTPGGATVSGSILLTVQ